MLYGWADLEKQDFRKEAVKKGMFSLPITLQRWPVIRIGDYG
jgi:hypothetical protein